MRMLIVVSVVVGMRVSGCMQTVRGIAHDAGSICNYVEDNVPAHDSREPYRR